MKRNSLFLALIIFAFLFFYLHQKVRIYTTAFELSRQHENYQELNAQKDYLRYNFSKNVSLSNVSNWALAEDFSLPGKDRVLAFRPHIGAESEVVRERSFFERFQIPASISDVFARER